MRSVWLIGTPGVCQVDALLARRKGEGEHEALREIKNEFMALWDGMPRCVWTTFHRAHSGEMQHLSTWRLRCPNGVEWRMIWLFLCAKRTRVRSKPELRCLLPVQEQRCIDRARCRSGRY